MSAQQLAFDLDELTCPAYSGPRVGFHRGLLTLADVAAIEEEARRRFGNFGLAVGHPHIWFTHRSSSSWATPGHGVEIAVADLGCSDATVDHHWSRVKCSCVGGIVRRAFCECGWSSSTFADENEAVEEWHDHAWPGWRDLPVVPAEVRPHAGGFLGSDDKAARARARAWVAERYPAEWQWPGAPVLTERTPPGTRHVPGYSPWGGFDIARERAA